MYGEEEGATKSAVEGRSTATPRIGAEAAAEAEGEEPEATSINTRNTITRLASKSA